MKIHQVFLFRFSPSRLNPVLHIVDFQIRLPLIFGEKYALVGFTLRIDEKPSSPIFPGFTFCIHHVHQQVCLASKFGDVDGEVGLALVFVDIDLLGVGVKWNQQEDV